MEILGQLTQRRGLNAAQDIDRDDRELNTVGKRIPVKRWYKMENVQILVVILQTSPCDLDTLRRGIFHMRDDRLAILAQLRIDHAAPVYGQLFGKFLLQLDQGVFIRRIDSGCGIGELKPGDTAVVISLRSLILRERGGRRQQAKTETQQQDEN